MKWTWWIAGIVLLSVIFDGSDDQDQPRNATASTQAVENPMQPQNQQPKPQVQADIATYLYVTGNGVRQQAGPTTSTLIMGQLSRGARVRLVESSNGWTQIVSSFGNGWMSSQYLSPNEPIVATIAPTPATRQIAAPTTRDIRDARSAIIRQSIASYPGSCPCPYNRDRGGRRCGGRSAWSRAGGYSPLCYDS